MPCPSVIYLTVTASAEKQEECYEAKRQKSKLFFDCGSGDILYSLDDKTVTDLQGNYMLRIDKNTVMDLNSGAFRTVVPAEPRFGSDDDDDPFRNN